MENEATKNRTTRVGYAAADATVKEFDSGKKVANVTIMAGSGEDKQTTYVRGWNAMADRLKEIKKGEKWEFKGEVSKETNKDRTFDVMNARESYPHVKMEVRGEVKHKQEKKVGQTEMTNIMVVSSEMAGGKAESKVYNIELYGPNHVPKAKGIQVGDIVSTQGHVRMYDYVKEGEEKTIRSFQNPYEIENHTQREAKKGKGTKKDKKKTSGKDMTM